MSAIQINLAPEDIEALVKDSIMKSGFGAAVTTAVNESLRGYDSPIKKAVNAYVGRVCERLIEEKLAPAINAIVAEHVEKMVTKEVLDKVTYETVDKMVKAAERY